MPPLLIALGVVAAYFLIPKSQRTTGAPAIVVTPGDTPIGITTGFAGAAQPVAQAPVAAPIGGSQSNAPATASSGVPNTSIQTSSAAPVASQPSYFNPQQEFYANLNSTLRPIFTPTRVPQRPAPAVSGGCGCGGGNGGGASDCSSAKARYSNSGCLAPTPNSIITPSTVPFLDRWMANLQSSPETSAFGAYQDVVNTIQNQTPQGSDVAPPVGNIGTHIGLSYLRPVRSSVTGF